MVMDNNAPAQSRLHHQGTVFGECMYLKRNGSVLSPDLNPVENLRDQPGRRVEARYSAPQNLNNLRAALQQEWDAAPQQIISPLN